MRWILKEKKSPQIGDMRCIEKFIWLPLRLGDEVRWLENAFVNQKFTTGDSIPRGWHDYSFSDDANHCGY